jgi:protein transport protein SEC61 subunit gamma-like protein
MVSFDPNAQIIEPVQNFIKQSERVINVTHKPRGAEFWQIAYITAIGMAVIGVIGFAISMTSDFLRHM